MGKQRISKKKAQFLAAVRESEGKKRPLAPKKKPAPKIGEALPPLPPAFQTPLLDTKGFQEQLRELIATHGLIVSDIPSLLCEPHKVPRPTAHGERLYRIAISMPHHYGRMISAIMLGASVPACLMFIGVNRLLLAQWRQLGLIDLSNDHDTLFARFVNDINFAATIPYLDAEIAVHRKDPLEWLRTGPGRWLSNEGTWQLQSTKGNDSTPPQITPSETVGIAESVEAGQDEINLLESAPTVRDLPDALQVLKDCGLEHVILEAQKVNSDAGHSTEATRSGLDQDQGRADSSEVEED